MANELATAYLALVPSMGGMAKTIERELNKEGLGKVGEKEGEKLGAGMASKAGSKLASGLKTAATAAGAVAAAALAGAISVGKESLDAYAIYEQLVGGMDTLFKESSDQMQKYASQAYKTAGLSANEYMETATSFSASLISSLGGNTEKAAELANLAIVDMSDNANKMGSSMESIQNAYQGFAKQNYTMLDNLKLGYGGTQEEMKRLLADATAISGINYDISSYADIVEAIHVIQTQWGITGTTAAEASATISGSISSAQSAWSNWLTGLANEDADLAALTEQLVDSVVTAAGNIIPRVGVIASSLLNVLGDKAGDMMVKGVEWMSNLAAGIAEGASFVWSEIQRGISEGLARIGDSVGSFIQAGKDLVAGIAKGITDAAGAVWDAITRICSNSLDSIKSFFGIASPSKVMREMFGYVGEGMALGLEDKAARVTGAMNGIASSTVNAAAFGMSPAGAFGGTVNIYIDGNLLVGNERIRGSFGVLLDELERMGLM
jgi:phage-related protein